MSDELRARLEEILAGLPQETGPIRNPVDRFSHLPENSRRWLESLRQEDLDDIQRILESYRKTGVIMWFFKWIIITVGTTFVGVVAFGEKIAKVLAWVRGGTG